MISYLQTGLAETELSLSPAQLEQCAQFSDFLVEKNKVMNLTGLEQPEEIATMHFLDCLLLQSVADFSNQRILDVGSGAGFPGVPLAIAAPTGQFTLLDAQQKRVNFLAEAKALCGIKNITPLHARAEELAQDEAHRAGYDLVTSRAVASLPMLCELSLPFLKVGGRALFMKSTDSQPEVDAAARAISILGGRLLPHTDYQIPLTKVTHRVILVEKISNTAQKYPRRFAKIQKQPL